MVWEAGDGDGDGSGSGLLGQLSCLWSIAARGESFHRRTRKRKRNRQRRRATRPAKYSVQVSVRMERFISIQQMDLICRWETDLQRPAPLLP